MLNTLINQVTTLKGLFSSGYFTVYFLPALVVYGLLWYLGSFMPGEPDIFEVTGGTSLLESAIQAIKPLAVIAFVALLLQAFNTLILRMYSGTVLPHWIRKGLIEFNIRTAQRLYKTFPNSDVLLYYPHPDARDFFEATAIGNTLSAFEYHAKQAYGLSPATFLPLLIDEIKETQTSNELTAAQDSLVAWINASLLLYTGSVLSFGQFLGTDWAGGLGSVTVRLGICVLLLALGVLAARLALARTRTYTMICRSALAYRLRILKALNLEPATLAEEQSMWAWLNVWMGRHQDYREWFGARQRLKLPVVGASFTPETFLYKSATQDTAVAAAAQKAQILTAHHLPIPVGVASLPTNPGYWIWLGLGLGALILLAPTQRLETNWKRLAPARVFLSSDVEAYRPFDSTEIKSQPAGRQVKEVSSKEDRYLALQKITKDQYFRNEESLPAVKLPTGFTPTTRFQRLSLPLSGLTPDAGELVWVYDAVPPTAAPAPTALSITTSDTTRSEAATPPDTATQTVISETTTSQTITPQATPAVTPTITGTHCPEPDSPALLGCALVLAKPANDRVSVYASPELIAQLAARKSDTDTYQVLLTTRP